MSIRNRLFAKNGHECTIATGLEDLPMFRQSPNILTQIKNLLIRFRMASELNYRCQTFLRSQRNLDLEHRRHVKHLFIIHPFSDFRKCWEIFMIVVLLGQFIMIPLDVSFFKVRMVNNCTLSPAWRIIRAIADCFCVVDIFMTFFTGYCDYRKKIVIMNPKSICMKYLWSYFIPDVLSAIPTGYGVQLDNLDKVTEVLTYLSPLRLLRIISFLRYCKQFCQTYQVSYSTYKIVLIFLMYMLYWHILCCITIYLATNDVPQKIPTTMYSSSRANMPYNLLYNVETTYFYVFYETARLINNAGYLELTTDKYNYYTILVWILSKLFYMYLTSLVLDVIISRTSAIQKYYELVSELRDYMGHNRLPPYLQKRLLIYYDFRYERTYFREHEILNTISGQLKQEVVMHKCRKLVEHVDFFKNLPLTLLMRIVSVLHQEFYLTNDVIIKIGTFGDCMYFIALGTVAIYTAAGKEVCHLADGDHFGEVALIEAGEVRTAAVVAVDSTELFRLDRMDFMRAILPYPDLLTKIQYIAQLRVEETTQLNSRSDANLINGYQI